MNDEGLEGCVLPVLSRLGWGVAGLHRARV